MRIITPFIMDIEASGFGAESYPIEIGLALEAPVRYCSLIQPATDWVHWDDSAEQIHGVTRAVLHAKGKSIRRVAVELNELLGHATVYSDAWVVDKPWLTRLYEVAGLNQQFTLSSIESILSEAQLAIWDATKFQVQHDLQLPRHRASNDALIIQETYRRTRYDPQQVKNVSKYRR